MFQKISLNEKRMIQFYYETESVISSIKYKNRCEAPKELCLEFIEDVIYDIFEVIHKTVGRVDEPVFINKEITLTDGSTVIANGGFIIDSFKPWDNIIDQVDRKIKTCMEYFIQRECCLPSMNSNASLYDQQYNKARKELKNLTIIMKGRAIHS